MSYAQPPPHYNSYRPPPYQAALYTPSSSTSISEPMSGHCIPTAARERYERLFLNETRGNPYLNGVGAASLFMESGLSRADLSRIWEDLDRSHDGRLGKDEFVQTMWKIDLQKGRVPPTTAMQSTRAANTPMPPSQQYQPRHPSYNRTPTNAPSVQPQAPYASTSPQPSRQGRPSDSNLRGIPKVELLTAILCKGCGIGLASSDIVYHSSSDYFCTTCPHPPTFAQVTLIAGKGLPTHNPSLLDGCSGCWKDIKKGGMMWRCNKCWDDKALCEKCWKKPKKHCKHVSSGHVILMRVVDGEDDDDDDDNSNNNDDNDGLEDLIDGIANIIS